ncbi:Predicted arabinose efflux permease, MFS family [Gemmobacter megaterium]|uniref:Predicted arabinose efflux permease, MFS family n=1 Tax=Gemmobacter megaterium TaxID=1086013 RepID=A0A1N7Q5L4_9RHOB|nr:MFS transporter [Gemmobacter megaterium]GGE23241.1 MFS transporter [Gemmobacter megaterium]SIT18096.1 Predicted arabinose efflux permease, MFS family [Gemmobacter megaterium]
MNPDGRRNFGPAALAVTVVVIGFACNFLARGVVDTFMVFMQPLEQEFGWNHAQLTQVYSVYLITLGAMSPFTGTLLDSWGPRISYLTGAALLATAMFVAGNTSSIWHLYLAPGVLCGMAASLMGMVPAAALIGRWFDRQMGLMVAIAYAGFGSGMLAIVPLAQAGIDAFGWRETYRILFWCCAALVPLLALVPWGRIGNGAAGNTRATAARDRSARGGARQTGPQWTVRSAMRTAEFWLLVQAFFFTAVAAYLTTVQVISFLISREYPPIGAALAFGTAGMLSIFGVILSGWAMMRFGIRRATLVSYVGTMAGILALLAFARWPHPALVWVFILTFGTSQGARGPVISALNARIFARGRVSSIYGLIFMLMSFGSAFGAWLSGRLYAWTGDYSAAFVVAAAAVLLAAAPFVLTRRLTEAQELAPPHA